MFWPKFPRGSVKDCCWLPLTRQGRACGDPVSIESKCGSWPGPYCTIVPAPVPALHRCPVSTRLHHQTHFYIKLKVQECFNPALRFKDCVLLKVERFRKSFSKSRSVEFVAEEPFGSGSGWRLTRNTGSWASILAGARWLQWQQWPGPEEEEHRRPGADPDT